MYPADLRDRLKINILVYFLNSASIQPRTSHRKFSNSPTRNVLVEFYSATTPPAERKDVVGFELSHRADEEAVEFEAFLFFEGHG